MGFYKVLMFWSDVTLGYIEIKNVTGGYKNIKLIIKLILAFIHL